MAKRGRPVTYQSEDKKPVTVSLRIPRDVYEQTQRYVRMHYPMTLTDLLLDGLRLRLETPADPRDIILSDDNTVIQELQGMIQAAVQAEIGKLSDFMGTHFSTPGSTPAPEAPAEPVPDKPHYDNTVIQEKASGVKETQSPPHAHAPGQRGGGQSKLNERQARALRAKRQKGVPIKALMEEYGLSKATVFRYLAADGE